MQYRTEFDRSSKKFDCPKCGHKKRYRRYVYTDTGEYLPYEFGKCDRKESCQYWRKPETSASYEYRPLPPKPQQKPVFYPLEVLKQTLTGYEQNVFIQNLLHRVPFPLPSDEVQRAVELYHIGTITGSYRQGAVTFPYIDEKNRVQAIQVKVFDESNHTTEQGFLHGMLSAKHKGQKTPLPEWLRQYQAQEKKIRCLFGAHLLKKYPRNPVAIVEAAKTAVIATLYYGHPADSEKNFIWLGSYNLSSLQQYKCDPLKGRKVVLFPDLSATGQTFNDWSEKAQYLEAKIRGATFRVSDLLERKAGKLQREQGADIADYLSKLDWRLFREQRTATAPEEPEPAPMRFAPVSNDWSKRIGTIEADLLEIDYSSFFKLSAGCEITNPEQFAQNHLRTVKAQNGNETYLPYLIRLEQFVATTKSFQN
jgi:hypothetical protein